MDKKEIRDFLRTLSLLYVEDDEHVAQTALSVLERFFAKIHHAENGLKGLTLFQSEKPDIIITDIQMPEMNGIEMSAEIRKTDSSVPIIITSAYNDTDYLHQAIQAGIDEYLVKPINITAMVEKLEHLGSIIKNQKDAESYRKQQLAEKINHTEQSMIRDMGNALPLPFVMLDGEEVIHINDSFTEILQPEQLKSIQETRRLSLLEESFQQRDGYISSLQDLQGASGRVILRSEKQLRFFQIGTQNLQLQGQEKAVTIFYFNDITDIEKQKIMIQYQKNKLANLNELLSGYYYHQLTENKKKAPPVPDAVSKEVIPDAPMSDSSNFADTILEEDQRDILRRSHIHKSTAQEYVAELGADVVEEVVELRDTENDARRALDRFVAFKEGSEVRDVGTYLEQYAGSIHSLIEFADLATALETLGAFLSSLEDSQIESNEKKILLYMHNILEDLSQWRSNIFENPTAKDIHYLDSSLFSSCLQFQLDLQPKEANSEDEDDLGLELF